MGTRKRHSVTLRSPTQGGPRRYQSGAVRIDDRVRLGHALAMALEPFGLGVAVVEPGTLRVTFASEALGALLGATVDELTGLSSLRERVMPADVAAAEACLGATRASESTIHFLHSWGDPVELDLSVRPFDSDQSDGKEPRLLAVVFRGVGERHERESLRVAVGEAAEALRARDELFSMATHELRTPLTALRLHAQALVLGLKREPPDLGRARRLIGEVERHAERMTVLVTSSSTCREYGAGASRFSGPRWTSPWQCATSRPASVQRQRAWGATIIIDGERSVPGHWDPFRIEQVGAEPRVERAEVRRGEPDRRRAEDPAGEALHPRTRPRSADPRGGAGADSRGLRAGEALPWRARGRSGTGGSSGASSKRTAARFAWRARRRRGRCLRSSYRSIGLMAVGET